MKINGSKEHESGNILMNLIKGIGMAYFLTIIVFIIYAVLLTYTAMTEEKLQLTVMLVTVISVIIAGLKTSIGAKSKGWLWGIIAGFTYALIMIMAGVCISPVIKFSSKTIMILVLSLAGGGLGGIIGINIKK